MAVAEDRCGVGDGEGPAATAALCSVQLRDCRYDAEEFDLLERESVRAVEGGGDVPGETRTMPVNISALAVFASKR